MSYLVADVLSTTSDIDEMTYIDLRYTYVQVACLFVVYLSLASKRDGQ